MATTSQDNKGRWIIEGLKWERTEGVSYPSGSPLEFKAIISFSGNSGSGFPITITESGETIQTDWITTLGEDIIPEFSAGSVTRRAEDNNWYTYIPMANFEIKPFQEILSATCSNTSPESAETSATLSVTANVDWAVTANVNWITISPSSGTSGVTSAIVTYAANTGSATRTGNIHVQGINKSVDISVEQQGALIPTISIYSPSPIDAAATSISYTATSSMDNVTVKLSNGSTSTDKIGSFSISANTGTTQKTYTLTAYCTDYPSYSATTQVRQNAAAHQFSVSPTSFTFSAEESTGTITITNPGNYGWAFCGLTEWLSVSQVTGSSSTSVTITASANTGNERTTTITVKSSQGDSIDVGITQYAPGYHFVVSPTSFTFPAEASTSTLDIDNPNEYEWQIEGTIPDWLYISQTGGSASAAITLSCSTNTSTNERVATGITVRDVTNSKDTPLNISQEGSSLPPAVYLYETGEAITGETAFTYNEIASALTYHLVNNPGITIDKPDWLWVSGDSANHTINYSAETNNTGNERSGNIELNGINGGQAIYGITQGIPTRSITLQCISGGVYKWTYTNPDTSVVHEASTPGINFYLNIDGEDKESITNIAPAARLIAGDPTYSAYTYTLGDTESCTYEFHDTIEHTIAVYVYMYWTGATQTQPVTLDASFSADGYTCDPIVDGESGDEHKLFEFTLSAGTNNLTISITGANLDLTGGQ